MLAIIVGLAVFAGVVAIFGWLAMRARKGRISATTPLGASYELLSKDQRKAAEVIVNKNASKKMEEQASSDPERPGRA